MANTQKNFTVDITTVVRRHYQVSVQAGDEVEAIAEAREAYIDANYDDGEEQIVEVSVQKDKPVQQRCW